MACIWFAFLDLYFSELIFCTIDFESVFRSPAERIDWLYGAAVRLAKEDNSFCFEYLQKAGSCLKQLGFVRRARTGRRRDWPLLHVAYVAFTRSLCWCALLTCIDWQACEDIQTASRAALASFTVSIVEIVWFTKLSQKQPGKAFWKSAVLSRLSRPAWVFKGWCQ